MLYQGETEPFAYEYAEQKPDGLEVLIQRLARYWAIKVSLRYEFACETKYCAESSRRVT